MIVKRIMLVRTSLPGGLERGFGPPPVAPPLGLLHVSAWLRQNIEGLQVRVVDGAVDLTNAEDLVAMLVDFRPDLVGLSGLTNETTLIRQMADSVRSWNQSVPIVIGGPVASSDPTGTLERIEAVDFAVFGEGEETFVDLVDALRSDRDPATVKGLALRDGTGRPRRTPRRRFLPDLDVLPDIDWDEVRLESYGRIYNFNDLPVRGGTYIPLFTSRGCPYRCTFCHGHFGRKPRVRDPELVVAEMARDVQRWGVREFHILDDIFNYRKGRVQRFCSAVEAKRLDVRIAFPNGIRGDRLDRGDIEALAGAGCRSMSLALETLTPRFEHMIRKKLDVDRVLRNAEIAADNGILTRCFIMLGFPGETIEEMRNTIDRVTASAFDLVHIFPVAPNPGTDLFDLAVEAGWEPERWHDSEYDYDKCFINASGLPDEVFTRFLDEARIHPYRQTARRRRIRAHYESLGFPGHELFSGGQHWRMMLADQLERDSRRPTSQG